MTNKISTLKEIMTKFIRKQNIFILFFSFFLLINTFLLQTRQGLEREVALTTPQIKNHLRLLLEHKTMGYHSAFEQLVSEIKNEVGVSSLKITEKPVKKNALWYFFPQTTVTNFEEIYGGKKYNFAVEYSIKVASFGHHVILAFLCILMLIIWSRLFLARIDKELIVPVVERVGGDNQGKIIPSDVKEFQSLDSLKEREQNLLTIKNKMEVSRLFSHAIKEPISNIENFLIRTKHVPEKTEELIDKALEVIHKTKRGIKNHLQKQKNKGYSFTFEALNFEDFLQRDWLSLIKYEIPKGFKIKGDRHLLRVMFDNLFSNALYEVNGDHTKIIFVIAEKDDTMFFRISNPITGRSKRKEESTYVGIEQSRAIVSGHHKGTLTIMKVSNHFEVMVYLPIDRQKG